MNDLGRKEAYERLNARQGMDLKLSASSGMWRSWLYSRVLQTYVLNLSPCTAKNEIQIESSARIFVANWGMVKSKFLRALIDSF